VRRGNLRAAPQPVGQDRAPLLTLTGSPGAQSPGEHPACTVGGATSPAPAVDRAVLCRGGALPRCPGCAGPSRCAVHAGRAPGYPARSVSGLLAVRLVDTAPAASLPRDPATAGLSLTRGEGWMTIGARRVPGGEVRMS
jgi:hypothetical protein